MRGMILKEKIVISFFFTAFYLTAITLRYQTSDLPLYFYLKIEKGIWVFGYGGTVMWHLKINNIGS